MPGAESALAVLDASIAVKWLIPESDTEQALALLRRHTRWLAPRLLLVEVVSAMRRRVQESSLGTEEASTNLTAVLAAVRQGVVLLADDEELVLAALALSLSLAHRVPDCLYLALAQREGAPLATADAKLAALARQRGIDVLGIGAAA